MTSRQWIVVSGLLALAIVAIVGLKLTGDSTSSDGRPSRARTSAVNTGLLQQARNATPIASGWREQRYAQEAIRIADHEVDLAFAQALRDTSGVSAPPTRESKATAARIHDAELRVQASQGKVDSLQKQLAGAATGRDSLQLQLDVETAQLELDKDELEDARQDLTRSGADPQSRVRRQFRRHQSVQHQGQEVLQSTANAPQANEPGGDLVANIRVWYTLQRQIAQLKSAREAALAANASISKTHDELEQTARAKGLRSNNTADPASASNPSAPATAGTEQSRGALLASLQSLSQDQKNLASLDQRIQDTQDLAEILSDWTGLVQTRQMVAFRGVIRSALWILMIVLLFYIGARVVERYIPDVRSERSRMHTMRTIVKVAVQSIGVLLILFVIFGAPTQLSTVLALAGAGLTVALKDFIVAFLGWFVLMGRNGIRIGDWVEIHGVVGEVVEINLLRTLLLETGNWKEPGHPTGRKVAFMNGYAIEGHFFNFSTSGQWLWDELQISIPSNENLHAVLEAIQQLVVKETAPNAKLAEQEWQRAAGRYKVMQSVSATPAVQVRPTPNGVQVNVRYISRANESYALRARLYQSVVDLLHDSSLSRTEPEAVQSVE